MRCKLAGCMATDDGFEVLIDEMEFLGSYWRCRLKNDRFGDNELIADFSEG